MSIEKKSLISKRNVTKKAIVVKNKPEVSKTITAVPRSVARFVPRVAIKTPTRLLIK